MNSVIPVLDPASPQAEAINNLFLLVLLISAVIFAIVTGLILIAISKGRRRQTLPDQDFGSEKAEIAWIVGPVVIVLWLIAISANLVITLNAIPDIDPDGKEHVDDVELIVTGHQWWWEVEYPKAGVISANEIHLPASPQKKYRILVKSDDVIHCFWVPQLGRKIDAIPGRENYIWLQANQPGIYQGRCSEYCGAQHAWMNFKVIGETEEEYQNWLTGQQQKPEPTKLISPLAMAGREYFFKATCPRCHKIEGTSAQAMIGPDLTHFASRMEIGSGVLENSTENLTRWLKDPQAVKPGCKMPNFKLSETNLKQLVAYLETLK
ncbi:cytochrome c oxidase subunit II [Gimesia panareensis]|uniref:cytochrome c oxidase subunit II n=1 Tax=Gimesia panareensis TaxID=2527978 RepID=UPI00118A5424|nr:cytochrome c oxidase subunit II [Gimesia panareensis]QDU49151.1 Cytochrome c oxidase subunit 2 precursor [Gimesia panareensis]